MNNPRALKIVIALLSVALITSLAFLGRTLWQNFWWEEEVYELVGVTAARQALDDFRQGKLRLRALHGENEKLRFSGSNDGPFEIWIVPFHPSLGYPHRFATEQEVKFYNEKMRYMQTHPEKF